jgi:hypothetical protein
MKPREGVRSQQKKDGVLLARERHLLVQNLH